jgi:hypothetical protein
VVALSCVAEGMGALAGLALPGDPGDEDAFEWRKGVFAVARKLQALGVREPAAVETLVRAWHGGLTDCRCGWGPLWRELRRCWGRVRNPSGETLAEIWHRPDPRPVPVAVHDVAGKPIWECLLRGLRNLADYWSGEPFPLGCRDAGELVGIHFTDAARKMNALARARVLRLVAKGSRRKVPGKDCGTASVWQWLAEEG